MLDGVYSPWRNTTDLAINKDFRVRRCAPRALRLEVINLFDNPWYAALAEHGAGQHELRPRHRAGELLADVSDHGAVFVLGGRPWSRLSRSRSGESGAARSRTRAAMTRRPFAFS